MTKHISRDQRSAMKRLCAGLTTKSDKIRALGSADFTRADIARYLDIRYQHVRNVLVKAEEKDEKQRSNEMDADPPKQIWTQVGPDGRVVIPAAYRPLLGIEGGGHVLMLFEDGAVRVLSRDGAIRRAQEIVAPYLKHESASVEAFLAQRRREARREERKERRE